MVRNCVVFCLIFVGCNSSPEPIKSIELIDPNKVEVEIFVDSFSNLSIDSTKANKDSIRKMYEEDLALEIKEIEEEEKNPISDECKLLLEDYANSIASYSAVLKKIEANQNNINLIIARSAQEEEMYAYSSFPEMFSCLQNPAFQKQVEILNDKRDKIISQ